MPRLSTHQTLRDIASCALGSESRITGVEMTTNLNDAGFWDSQSGYQRVPHNFTSFYAEQAWHLADVRSGARVLAIAAGAGALALVAARAGASVLATDFSFGKIGRAPCRARVCQYV